MGNTPGLLSSPRKRYEYRPLDTAEEIRLVNILPGQFNDGIQIEIHHTILQLPDATPTRRLPINQLRESLPDGWQIFETIECNYLFWKRTTGETSWHHPNPGVSRMLYAPMPNYPDDTFLPKYEALSSTWSNETPQVAITVVNIAEAPEEHSKIEVRSDLASAIRQLRLTDRTRTLWIDEICVNQTDYNETIAQAKRSGRIYVLASAVIVWLGHQEGSAALGLSALANFGQEIQYTLDDFCFPTPQAIYPDWFKKSTVPPFNVDEWIGIVDLLRHAWFKQRWTWQEIQLGNRNRIIMCGESARPWEMVSKAILALFGRVSLPYAVVGLIYECYWLADIKATFDVDTILAIERSTGAMDLTDAVAPELMNRTVPSWTPDLARVAGARTWLWQVSTGISRANARCLEADVLEVHGVICGTVESVFTSDWIPEDISHLPVLLQKLSACNPVGKRLNDGSIDLIDELVSIACDCFTDERLPHDAGAWDKQEIRKLLQAATTEDGEWNASIKDGFWTQCKAQNHGRSLIISDTGLIGKIEAGRQEARAGDIISTLLGRSSPLILRPVGNGYYIVVAGAMVPDLCDSVSILGPLPHPWKMQFLDLPDQPEPQPHYINPTTGVTTREDPRLGPLPPDWIRVQGEWYPSVPVFGDHFQNTKTGEVVHWDPRLDSDALKARGVAIRTFLLK